MNDSAVIDSETARPHVQPVLTMSAGGMLKAAREREGLHIAALAVSMKVPVKKLEALESDRLDLLPDIVFVRALAASVCRALKVDPEPVLNLLPAGAPPLLKGEQLGINTPFSSASHPSRNSFTGIVTRPAAAFVIALVLAAGALLLLPETPRELSLFSGFKASNLGVNTPAPSEPLFPPSAPLSAMETPASLQAPITQTQSPALTIPTAAASPLDPSAVVPLLFRTKGEAWVQVTDSRGVQLVSRTLQAGEALGVTGSLPLAVIVGRSDLTSVDVFGKPFDLTAMANNNVAKFEVKQ